MYSTTALSRERVVDLCAMIHSETMTGQRPWPPILGLFRSVTVALTYMRRNRVQAELAETCGVSQPTISRAITGVTPLLGKVLKEYVPVADSGKHKTTGMNVQVACTLTGRLAWISDAVSGSRHDTYCLSESGVLLTLDPGNWIGDKGYVGNDMITPIKKPACRDLLDWEKEFNKQVNKIRYVIEQTIANFKTWRIMHTDYRRPLATFTTTISTVIALHFYAAD